MTHLEDEILVAVSLDLLSGSARDEATGHLQSCAQCSQEVEGYRAIAATLRVWHEVPRDAAEAATRALVQRARLYRLLGQMVTDPTLRKQARTDPGGLLTTHGVAPSPQLLAAFRELDIERLERFRGELDERISKLFNLLS